MAEKRGRRKNREKRVKNTVISFDRNRSVFDIILKPILPFGIRHESFNTPVEESQNNETDLSIQLSQIKQARQLLSTEKMRILYLIKHNKPSSVYELAKLLKRDFKAVRQDLKILEEIGFIAIVKEKVKNRVCAKPILRFDKINVSIEV